jgi:uncharacterized protein
VIFVDTSFWAVFHNKRDKLHLTAKVLLRVHSRETLVTTNHVRGETWTVLNRRAGHVAGVAFLDALERSPRIRVITIASDVETTALSWLRRHDERQYSFVDATGFQVMWLLKIYQVLAFDGDFADAGFHELRPE